MKSPALFSPSPFRLLRNAFSPPCRYRLLLVFGLFAYATSSPAHADPVTVTSGSIRVDFEGDFFDLRSTTFQISTVSGSGIHIPKSFQSLCFPCRAGDVVSLGFRTDGGDQFAGSGPATFNGVSHPELFYMVQFNMMAEGQAFPASTDSSVRISQRFEFEGLIRAYAEAAYRTQVFMTPLRGAGLATTRYHNSDLNLDAYFPEEGQIAYVFETAQVVPEPTTLVLFGSGLCVIVARRWRRPRATRPL